MPTELCQVCRRPSPNSIVCTSCSTRLGNTLRELPELARELEVTVLRQSRINTGENVRPGASGLSPILFHPPAAAIRDDLGTALHAYVRQVEEYLPSAGFHSLLSGALKVSSTGRIGKLALLLHAALPSLSTALFLPEMVCTIHALAARAGKIIDLPADRTHFYVGPCPELDADGGHCVGDIWAWFPRDVEARPLLQCNECETQWFSETWLRLGSRIAAERSRRFGAETLAREIIHLSVKGG